MFDGKSSGRCLVFSFKLAEDGVVIASKDCSRECPDFENANLVRLQDVRAKKAL